MDDDSARGHRLSGDTASPPEPVRAQSRTGERGARMGE